MELELFDSFSFHFRFWTGFCPEIEHMLFDSLYINSDTCYCFEIEPKLFSYFL